MRQNIEDRFNTEAKTLPVLRERFAAAVTRWTYSATEIWSYEDMRFHCTDDSLLPGAEGVFYACGFDASDRPIYLKGFETKTSYGDSDSDENIETPNKGCLGGNIRHLPRRHFGCCKGDTGQTAHGFPTNIQRPAHDWRGILSRRCLPRHPL